MKHAVVKQFCKDCKEITNHFYGESMGGKKYVECESCGRTVNG